MRRFLETEYANIDAIVFVLSSAELVEYRNLAPLYFPRSLNEQLDAIDKLPVNTGTHNAPSPTRRFGAAAKKKKKMPAAQETQLASQSLRSARSESRAPRPVRTAPC